MQWVRVSARLKAGFSRVQAQMAVQVPYRQIIEQETRDAGFPVVSPAEREEFLQSRIVLLPGGQGDSLLQAGLQEPLSRLMILAGLVLEVCRKVPPYRSTVRTRSKLSGTIQRVNPSGSGGLRLATPRQPRRIPTTS